MKKILAVALLAALPSLALAQSSPNLTKGQLLTAGQWNALFVGKQDTLGFIPLNTAGGTMSGRLITAASGATLSGFNLTPGTAPASPVNGDMWSTSVGLYVQVNGSTVGPLISAATPCTNCAVTNATNTFLNNQVININGGATPAAQAGMILQGVAAPATIGRLEIDTFAAATIFTGIRADGTVGSPTTLVANDEIVSVNAWGYDGTSRAGPASGMRQFAAGTWSNTNHPTYIDFVTTPAASTTLTTRLRVESDGGLTINGATSGGLGSIAGVDNSNRAFSWSLTNTSAGTSAAAQLNFTNVNGSSSFGVAGSANSNASLVNKTFIVSGTGLSGIALYNSTASPIDAYVNNVRVGGFTAAGAFDLGLAGTAVGSIVMHNVTSGGITLSPVAGALGTVTINVPAAAGTMAVSATAPVTLSAAGAIGCATCITSIALTGDVTGSGSTSIATTLATVNSNVGTFGSATQASQVTVNGKGLVTAAAAVTVTPAVGSITGLGTGVASALAVGVNGSGGLVTFSGTLGTPTSGTATNLTGLPISTGLTGAGTGVLAALAVNVGTAGSVVVNGGALGTPSSGTATNLTGLPVSTGISGLGVGVAAALGTTLNASSGLCTYQVGTWTPSFTGSTTPGTGQTYSLGPVGSYESCGRNVTARFSMQASSLGTAAGNLQISGLPLTSSATSNDFGSCFISIYAVTGLAASNVGVSGLINPGTTLANLFSLSNTGVASLTVAQAGASVEMIGTCTYRT